jgi:hypothetical protein
MEICTVVCDYSTKRGYLGLVPASVTFGDFVYLVPGFYMPVVLQPSQFMTRSFSGILLPFGSFQCIVWWSALRVYREIIYS